MAKEVTLYPVVWTTMEFDAPDTKFGPDLRGPFPIEYNYQIFDNEADARAFYKDLEANEPDLVRLKIEKEERFIGGKEMGGMSLVGNSKTIETWKYPADINIDDDERKLNPRDKVVRVYYNSMMGSKRFPPKEDYVTFLGKKNRELKSMFKEIGFEDPFLKRKEAMKNMDEADLTKGEKRKLKDMSKSLKKSSKGHASQAKYIDKLVKERRDAFSGYFSKASLGRMIMDAEEILKSGMQNGEPLDNETEMLVQQELERLKQLYVDNHGYTGIMATADPDLKKKKVMKFLKSKKSYREGMNLESIYEDLKEAAFGDDKKAALENSLTGMAKDMVEDGDLFAEGGNITYNEANLKDGATPEQIEAIDQIKMAVAKMGGRVTYGEEDEDGTLTFIYAVDGDGLKVMTREEEDKGKTISLYPFYNEKLAQKLFAMGIKDGYDWEEFLGKKLGGFWEGDPEGDGTMMYNIKEPIYSELRDRIRVLLKQIMAGTVDND